MKFEEAWVHLTNRMPVEKACLPEDIFYSIQGDHETVMYWHDSAIGLICGSFYKREECEAELIYGRLALEGFDASAERSEVHDRLMSNAAYVENGKVFCSCHEGTELDEEGSCHFCREAETQVGMDMAEAAAMRRADMMAETQDDSTFEENYPYYQERENQ